MKNKFKMIFCVLTYMNTEDLKNFLTGINESLLEEYHIIVVNSFWNKQNCEEFEKIAFDNGCDYVQVKNKGYGYGNNKGIEYANSHYDYDFIIICNPDTIIKKINDLDKYKDKKCIIAPKIIRNDGRNQNPMRLTEGKFNDRLAYLGYKNNIKILVLLHIINNRLDRLNRKRNKQIYECHGSFLIFTRDAIESLTPVYDENIFLLCEEGDLAKKCLKFGVPIIYDPDIVIRHFEDGSMKVAKINMKEIGRQSFIYYYEKWYRGRKE